MKNIIIIVLVLIIIGGGAYYFYNKDNMNSNINTSGSDMDGYISTTTKTTSTTTNSTTTTTTTIKLDTNETIIGTSTKGNPIYSFTYGTGTKNILVIGGIHGGYSANTNFLASSMVNFFKDDASSIPSNVKVTIIPLMNPDGYNKVLSNAMSGSSDADTFLNASKTLLAEGRFNASSVDLSRNFDCNWKASAKWQSTNVSGGKAPFSEPESMAIKSYVEKIKPSAVVVLYSAAGGVYSSACNGPIMPETTSITKAYAKASGYKAYDSFDSYETSGDIVNWLASIKIPAISVLLKTHEDAESDVNIKGLQALMDYYSKN